MYLDMQLGGMSPLMTSRSTRAIRFPQHLSSSIYVEISLLDTLDTIHLTKNGISFLVGADNAMTRGKSAANSHALHVTREP